MLKPCVVGLGYVGLPLLINLSKKFKIIGYDNDKTRISKLKKSIDTFKEFNKKALSNKNLYYSCSLKDIKKSNFYIVAVPTPIYRNKKPNLSYLTNVSRSLSKVISKGDLIFLNQQYIQVLQKTFVKRL